MATTADPEVLSRLKNLLSKEAGVSDEVVKYMIEDMGIEAISDFAMMFTRDTYENGVDEYILAKSPAAGKIIQRARLRAAWELALAEFSSALKKRALTTSTESFEWDSPLDPDVQRDHLNNFKNVYNITLDGEAVPSENLFGRLVREFKRNSISVYPLEKVKSATRFKTIIRKTERKIADGMSLTLHSPEEDSPKITSTLEVLWSLRILCNGWALAGMAMRDSKLFPSTKVRDAPLGECNKYFEFVWMKAMEHERTAGKNNSVTWLLERDRQTRAKARSLYDDGFPWTEALQESREKHLAVAWTIGESRAVMPDYESQIEKPSSSAAAAAAAVHPTTALGATPKSTAKAASGENPNKKPRLDTANFCRNFNDHRGCTRKQRQCPNRMEHKCSKCGAWQHGAVACPRH